MSQAQSRSPGLLAAIAYYGSMSTLAQRNGITIQAVAQWVEIPAERVIALHRDSKIPLSLLRPDLYPRDLIESARQTEAA